MTKEKKEGEKVCETFIKEKDGKEKTETACGVLENKPISREQIEQQNKTLRAILIILGIIILVTATVFFYARSTKTFDYSGISGEVIKEGDVTFYHTSFMIYSEKGPINYNVFLRNNPEQLSKIPFEGDFNLKKLVVMNITPGFNCKGDGVIATGNFNQILTALGATVFKDENASCDDLGRYTYINIQPGEKTSVEQFGKSCYNINVHNCEILKGTERFLMEMLIERNKN